MLVDQIGFSLLKTFSAFSISKQTDSTLFAFLARLFKSDPIEEALFLIVKYFSMQFVEGRSWFSAKSTTSFKLYDIQCVWNLIVKQLIVFPPRNNALPVSVYVLIRKRREEQRREEKIKYSLLATFAPGVARDFY